MLKNITPICSFRILNLVLFGLAYLFAGCRHDNQLHHMVVCAPNDCIPKEFVYPSEKLIEITARFDVDNGHYFIDGIYEGVPEDFIEFQDKIFESDKNWQKIHTEYTDRNSDNLLSVIYQRCDPELSGMLGILLLYKNKNDSDIVRIKVRMRFSKIHIGK